MKSAHINPTEEKGRTVDYQIGDKVLVRAEVVSNSRSSGHPVVSITDWAGGNAGGNRWRVVVNFVIPAEPKLEPEPEPEIHKYHFRTGTVDLYVEATNEDNARKLLPDGDRERPFDSHTHYYLVEMDGRDVSGWVRGGRNA